MKNVLVGTIVFTSLYSFTGIASAQAPRTKEARKGDRRAGPPRPQLGTLIPAEVRADLELTGDQTRQINQLEAEVKAKLDRILTAEQKRQLDRPRPRPRIEDEVEDHGRPVAQVAKELGVTPELFREAFRKVNPAGPGEEPTQEQRQQNRKILSEALGVSPERLDEVMDKYRPGGRGTNGPRSQ